MTADISIRQSDQGDLASIEALYPLAFPDEDLLPLVGALLREPTGILSFVATDGSSVVGHIMFTHCAIGTHDTEATLLGPLAVAPTFQRRGIGSSLIRTGLQRIKGDGMNVVCVLGDPAYYGRFGFSEETTILPPYALPEEWQTAWQALDLTKMGKRPKGRLFVPEPWQQPALWGP